MGPKEVQFAPEGGKGLKKEMEALYFTHKPLFKFAFLQGEQLVEYDNPILCCQCVPTTSEDFFFI